MAQALWKGSISFGLVHIPVALYSAENRGHSISFKQLDGRDLSPIRYKRINENTGKEVEWDEIVKGYEYEEGSYVVITDDDLKSIEAEANQMIEITDFVERSAIHPTYFERPYYLVPGKGGEKGYVLLREILERKDKVAIAKVVIRTKEYLSAVMPVEKALVLNLLRYEDELKKQEEFNIPSHSLKDLKVSEKELKLAERLLDEMADEWQPDRYKDHYHDRLEELVQRKLSGDTPKPIKVKDKQSDKKVIDMMELLEQSIKGKSAPKKARKRA